MEDQPTHTVHCFSNKELTKHFPNIRDAAKYANNLLAKKHQIKIYPYRPPRNYIDIVAERGPDG